MHHISDGGWDCALRMLPGVAFMLHTTPPEAACSMLLPGLPLRLYSGVGTQKFCELPVQTQMRHATRHMLCLQA